LSEQDKAHGVTAKGYEIDGVYIQGFVETDGSHPEYVAVVHFPVGPTFTQLPPPIRRIRDERDDAHAGVEIDGSEA
jgi:hypothetical protein